MTTISTTQFRAKLAEIFDAVQKGENYIVKMGRGKNAKYVSLNLYEKSSPKKHLPKNHSLLKFVESNYYKSASTNNIYSKIDNFKQFHKEHFMEDKFENRYSEKGVSESK
jgi:hypothetical protein